jgi:hypothetical protein
MTEQDRHTAYMVFLTRNLNVTLLSWGHCTNNWSGPFKKVNKITDSKRQGNCRLKGTVLVRLFIMWSNAWHKQLNRGRIYFSSSVQRVQSTIAGRAWWSRMFNSWQPKSRMKTGRGQSKRGPAKTLLSGLLFPTRPHFLQSYHSQYSKF